MVYLSAAEDVHDVAAAREHSDREPCCDGFGVGCEVGSHAIEFLSSAVGYSKAGDDFVEYDESAVTMCDLVHSFEVAGFRHDAVSVGVDGLHDDGGDLPWVSVESCFEEIDVVPLTWDDLSGRARVHTCRFAYNVWGFNIASFVDGWVNRMIHTVHPAVVVTFKPYVLRPAGVTSGEPQC